MCFVSSYVHCAHFHAAVQPAESFTSFHCPVHALLVGSATSGHAGWRDEGGATFDAAFVEELVWVQARPIAARVFTPTWP